MKIGLLLVAILIDIKVQGVVWKGCNWKIGDGVGGYDHYIGTFSGPKECLKRCQKYSFGGKKPNGATVHSSGKVCYCEFGSKTTDASQHYRTCVFPSIDCKTTTLGLEYRGTIAKTKSGKACIAWSTRGPHARKYGNTPEKHPKSGLVKNYCRNPTNYKHGPWCYTKDKGTSWRHVSYEACSVPFCLPVWDGCAWKFGDGDGDRHGRHRAFERSIGNVSGPKECVTRCQKYRHRGMKPNGATVDSRSGRKCYCEFRMKRTNKRKVYKTCSIGPSLVSAIDGGFSSWKKGHCSKVCDGGQRNYTRTCTNPKPQHGGKQCDGLFQRTEKCNEHPCPVDGGFSAWRATRPCTKRCGSGVKLFFRTCTSPTPRFGGNPCVGATTREEQCNTRPCIHQANWSPWTKYKECTKPCGGGKKWRKRYCNNPAPSPGGKMCSGKDKESADCNAHPCARQANWSPWGEYGRCSRFCGGGTKLRQRICNNPPPSPGGKTCLGESTESAGCNARPCPVDGGLSAWRARPCSKKCGSGVKRFFRSCTSPRPQFGGRNCVGPKRKMEQCNTQPCIEGNWSPWGKYSRCSKSCGGGTKMRQRLCNNPVPSPGAKTCPGRRGESAGCNASPCSGSMPVAPCQENSVVYNKCGHRCKCVDGEMALCHRVRKDFTSMSSSDRARYIRTYKIASTSSKYKREFDELIALHEKLFDSGIHRVQQFLPWHRWYLLSLENLLQKIDCKVTLPYWDWSLWSHDPWSSSSLWRDSDDGLGGNGAAPDYCVKTGPFARNKWSVAPSAQGQGTCLRRSQVGNPPDAAAVDIVLSIPASNFVAFEVGLRNNLHDSVHCQFSNGHGMMCTGVAASAPEFFLHHGFIDKLWSDWQKRSARHKTVYFSNKHKKMQNAPFSPSQMVDLSNLGTGTSVVYDDPTHHKLKRKLRVLRRFPVARLQKIPRRRFSGLSAEAEKLFKISSEEKKLAVKIENLIKVKKDFRIGVKGLSKEEKILGFKIDEITRG